MQYSINGNYPVINLPHRIRLSDGSTRTDNSTFTSTDLSNAGITTVSDPPSYDENTHKLTWDETNLNWEVVALTSEELQEIVDIKWQNIRSMRETMLAEADERVLRYHSENRIGVTTYSDNISELDTYIQALRDITDTYSNPDDVEWPRTPLTTKDIELENNE
tara:strand:- start:88 stop:576 length:489 start_codon:yes stop_codon:yes gene_type:complete